LVVFEFPRLLDALYLQLLFSRVSFVRPWSHQRS